MIGKIEPCHNTDQREKHGGNARAKGNKLACLLLKWCWGFRCGRDVCAYFAVFGRRPDLVDAHCAAALCDKRSGVAVVTPPVFLWFCAALRYNFPNAFGFTCQRRFVNTKVIFSDNLAVRGNFKPFGNHHQVPGDKIGAVNLLFFPVTDYRAMRGGKIFERF